MNNKKAYLIKAFEPISEDVKEAGWAVCCFIDKQKAEAYVDDINKAYQSLLGLCAYVSGSVEKRLLNEFNDNYDPMLGEIIDGLEYMISEIKLKI